MRQKFIKKFCLLCLCLSAAFVSGCGSNEPEPAPVESGEMPEGWNAADAENANGNMDGVDAPGDADSGVNNSEVTYDEDGNPVPVEPVQKDNIFAADAEVMVTGFFTGLENGSLTKNGVWMSEETVGMVAQRYASGMCDYEEAALGKTDASYIACFYDLNGNPLGSIYMDKNIDMYYNNKYKISDPQMRGIFLQVRDSVDEDSVLDFDRMPSGNSQAGSTGQEQEQPQGPDAVTLISKDAFMAVDGVDEETALVLAQSATNLGIPAVKQAAMEANTIVFTDVNDTQYTMAIVDGKIASVYDETSGKYLYRQGENNEGKS